MGYPRPTVTADAFSNAVSTADAARVNALAAVPSPPPPPSVAAPASSKALGSLVPGWSDLLPGALDQGGRLVVGNDAPYTAPGEHQWTPASARAWWNQWFAAPRPLYGVNPQDLPGSLVLSEPELVRARAINAALGPDPALAQGQNPGYRPGDTSINNSYDVLGYLHDLIAQKAAGTYKMVNDPSRLSGSDPMAADELDRAIEAARATIAQNKQYYDLQKAQQQAIIGRHPDLAVFAGAPPPPGSTTPATVPSAVASWLASTLLSGPSRGPAVPAARRQTGRR